MILSGQKLKTPVQLIFTLSCIFIFNGISSGMGKHNVAITDGDEQATALMVHLSFLLPSFL